MSIQVNHFQDPSAVDGAIDAGEERPQKAAPVADELLADGSMVLYHSLRKEIMTLNPTAALIWECCDGAHSLAMIATEVRELFPEAENAADDIRLLLQELRLHGMIHGS